MQLRFYTMDLNKIHEEDKVEVLLGTFKLRKFLHLKNFLNCQRFT